MINVFAWSSGWRKVRLKLSEGHSVLMIAPRGYGEWKLFKQFARVDAKAEGVMCVTLSSQGPSHEDKVSYDRLWSDARGQLNVKSKPKAGGLSREEFISNFATAVVKSDRPIVVLIGGSGRRNEENHYEVLETFHKMIFNRPPQEEFGLTVLAYDDYSLYYHSELYFYISFLHTYEAIHFAALEPGEIAACIRGRDGGEDQGLVPANPDEVARNVHNITGGHPALTQEVLEDLQRRCWSLPAGSWEDYSRALFRSSAVLEDLSRALEEDPEGYCKTALEYRKAAGPEPNSIRIYMLRQLGILQHHSAATVELCPGAITTLVERYGTRAAGVSPRVGTIFSDQTPRMVFEPGPIEPSDDDLVVLHLSDLHVGNHYRHRLTWPGGQLNPGENSAGELLRDDLNSLGLLGRIDGLVLSGDFVWDGEMVEFQRAKDVIEEILSTIGLGSDRMLLIPGNHDLCWDPGELASMPLGNRASRENYDDFLRLLGRPPGKYLDTLEITNRAGNARLRILGLDSNRVEGPDAAGVGFVSRECLAAAKSYLHGNDQKKEDAGQRIYSWIAVHHHLFAASSLPLADAQKKKVSVMANASEIIDYANQWGVELAMHGHEHQPSVTVVRRWPVDGVAAFTPLISVGAGSFGVVRDYLGPFARNQYYILYRCPDRIVIRSRCQGDSGVKFIPHSDMQVPR